MVYKKHMKLSIKTPNKKNKQLNKTLNKIFDSAKELAVKNLNNMKTPERNPLAVIKGRVICNRLAVRYEPNENSILKRIETKNTIIYLKECGSATYYQIFNEYDAYVSKKYIKVLDV